MVQLFVNSSSATFKFLFVVETSNMLVYMVFAGFDKELRLFGKHG
jgi:hypothetical protein